MKARKNILCESPVSRLEATEDCASLSGSSLGARRVSPQWPSLSEMGFTVVRTLGAGSMGVVLLVERDGRLYAVKIIRRRIGKSDSAGIERFIKKIELLSKIKHPNVVRVLEYGVSGGDDDAGVPFLVMEFVPGAPLNHIVTEEKSIDWKLSILAQVARGLDTVHAHGLVHRDIKPGNILVMDDGEAKLGDFGVAGIIDAESGGVLGAFGSPAYMAPEAFDPNRPKDGSSDIFSLGVVAYELLTGVKPFFASDIKEMKRAIQNTDPIDPINLEPAIPEDTRILLAEMLEKSPERRIGSAAEIAERLSGKAKAKPNAAERTVWRGVEGKQKHEK